MEDYNSVIDILNNFIIKNNSSNNKKNSVTNLLLKQLNVTSDDLKKMSIIHVTGTMGKELTCVFVESILRHHGYKTGFLSSLDIFKVRERIMINGTPLSYSDFSNYFWEVYNMLKREEDSREYFRFLTLMAFYVFKKEKVDVVIIEEGHGGEFGFTNVMSKTSVVGITPIDFDHIHTMETNIKDIAWEKAEIIKNECSVFIAPQRIEVEEVIKKICEEKEKTTLQIIEPFMNIITPQYYFRDHINTYISLAIAMANAWNNNYKGINNFLETFANTPQTKEGIQKFSREVRYEIIQKNNIKYFLDGAHTEESITMCREWFNEQTKESKNVKVLIFNVTGEGDSKKFLELLVPCEFDVIIFTTNVSGYNDKIDTKQNERGIMDVCYKHKMIWVEMMGEEARKNIYIYPTVTAAMSSLSQDTYVKNAQFDCLVTGSVYLAGEALNILEMIR